MSLWDDLKGILTGSGAGSDGGIDYTKLAISLGGGALLGNSGFSQAQIPQTGYQGGIPKYEAVRSPVPITIPEDYRPGSAGRRYFSDTRYATPGTAETARADAAAQAEGIAALNQANPFIETRPAPIQRQPQGNTSPIVSRAPARVIEDMPVSAEPRGLANFAPKYAQGGIARLAQGRYLNGESDGMADEVRANIDGKQEARLSDGEYVIPADVVSHLGNGNSDAGAKALDQMLSRVRRARTGNEKQGKEINPKQVMPS